MEKILPVKLLHIKGTLSNDGATILEYRIADRLKNKLIMDWLVRGERGSYAEKFESLGSVVYERRKFVKEGKFKSLKNLIFYYKFFKESHYEIVYCDTDTPSSVVLLGAAKLAGVKRIVVHSHNSKTEAKESKLKQRVCRALMPMILSDEIACSRMAMEWMFPRLLWRKTVIIKNGLDTEKFRYNPIDREIIRQQYHLDSDALVIGHVGRFVEQKNHKMIIEIFLEISKICQNAFLMLIGSGKKVEETLRLAAGLGLKEKLIYIESATDIYRFYSAMDLFLFPSLFEGLGMVAVEAQCSGLPTIMSTAVPEEAVITKWAYRISLSESAQVWASKIMDILSEHSKDNRDAAYEDIKRAGWDIDEAARKIANMFIR